METRNIKRNELRPLLAGPTLAGGKMLQVVWPRLRPKRVRNPETGLMETVEEAGTVINRRLILRNNWTTATPSGSFVPKGGIMFNVESQERAAEIRARHDLFLFLSLEGVTHPHREQDHAVAVPLDRVVEIRDTRDDILYRVED